MSTLKEHFSYLFEDPDSVEYQGTVYHMGDRDAIAFGYVPEQDRWFAKSGGFSHGEVMDQKRIDVARKSVEFDGRAWPKGKVLSFWLYPRNRRELMSGLQNVQDAFNDSEAVRRWGDRPIDFKSGWVIEVPDPFIVNFLSLKNDGNMWRNLAEGYFQNKDLFPEKSSMSFMRKHTVYIPIEDYRGITKVKPSEYEKRPGHTQKILNQ